MAAKSFFSSSSKIGVLGAGQLGRMMLPSAQAWDLHIKMLDPDPQAPCAKLCQEFVCGSLTDYETVYQFGKDCALVTIEIEHVNTEALQQLEEEGVTVHPSSRVLSLIQDKGLQKEFYKEHHFPTAAFRLYDHADEIRDAVAKGLLQFPFVQKVRRSGYDGKGVCIIRQDQELSSLLEGPSVVEDAIDIETEVAVIVARNANGEIATYDATMMEFHEGANMLDLLLYPAPLPEKIITEAKQLASDLIQQLEMCGLLAVEFLLDKQHRLWVNEVAPRTHNSGHQTIESATTSQFEQHLRAILNLPLGATTLLQPSAMVNLLGEEHTVGPVVYNGLEECLRETGVHLHLYGKKQTKPFRKMGHATVVHHSLDQAKQKALWVKQTVQVTAQK
jgi:5-(carboxyamino)imidazole ribonucleotide synthase